MIDDERAALLPIREHFLVAAGPARMDEPPAVDELPYERVGDTCSGGARDDAVVRGVLGQTERSVSGDDERIADLRRLEVATRLLGESGEPLDRVHLAAHHREDRRLEAEPGADLEDALATVEAEGVHHQRDERGLRGDLIVADGDGHVQIREMGPFSRNERRARHAAVGGQQSWIADAFAHEPVHEVFRTSELFPFVEHEWGRAEIMHGLGERETLRHVRDVRVDAIPTDALAVAARWGLRARGMATARRSCVWRRVVAHVANERRANPAGVLRGIPGRETDEGSLERRKSPSESSATNDLMRDAAALRPRRRLPSAPHPAKALPARRAAFAVRRILPPRSAAMPSTTKPRSTQPRPRERPEREIGEDGSASTPERHRRGHSHQPQEPRELEREEAPDMGIGLDERGEIDRRFEP